MNKETAINAVKNLANAASNAPMTAKDHILCGESKKFLLLLIENFESLRNENTQLKSEMEALNKGENK